MCCWYLKSRQILSTDPKLVGPVLCYGIKSPPALSLWRVWRLLSVGVLNLLGRWSPPPTAVKSTNLENKHVTGKQKESSAPFKLSRTRQDLVRQGSTRPGQLFTSQAKSKRNVLSAIVVVIVMWVRVAVHWFSSCAAAALSAVAHCDGWWLSIACGFCCCSHFCLWEHDLTTTPTM